MSPRIGTCLLMALATALVAGVARAGDEDSHLAATHYLARRAKLSEADAALIARADWSLDMNLGTTAMPWVDAASEIAKDPESIERIKWWVRGDVYHSFGSDPEDVRAHLSVLRGAVPTLPKGRPETAVEHHARMIAVGQYLHAMQDVYFHQQGGKPLGSVIGHALTGASDDREGMDWHEADKVNNHFDAALKAYNETAKVMEAVEQGKPIPDIDWKEAYVPDERRVHGAIVKDNNIPDEIVKLAVAIGGSYGDWHGEHDVPDHDVLSARIGTLWALQQKSAGFEPFVTLGEGERALINYDTNPQFLILREDLIADLMRRYPGGISFTEAAAQRLPIRIDIDGVLVDHGRIVLSGRSAGELQAFDAAQLLTAFRLACGHGDPYFSLDPVDGKQWMDQGKSLIEQNGRESDARQVTADYVEADGANLLGPISFTRRQQAGLPKGLESKLVFSPTWLRETRFGKTLYDADVLLKVLSTGAPLTEGGGLVRPPALADYHSAVEHAAARALLEQVEGKAAEASITGERLWFELGDQRAPDPFPYLSIPDFELPPGLFLSSTPSGRDVLKYQLQQRLGEAGLPQSVAVNVAGTTPPSQVSQSGAAMDLGSVWPRMYVRRHDAASGQDLQGESPDMQAVADDINSRTAEWAAQYPELQALVNSLRVYVAAVKATGQDRAICRDLSKLPLLPAERLNAPLPQTRPALLWISTAAYRAPGYPPDEATAQANASDQKFDLDVPGDLNYIRVYSLEGGVSLGMKGAPGVVEFKAGETSTTAALLAAPGDASQDGLLSLRWDLPEQVANATRFVPVTQAEVLGEGPMLPAAAWRDALKLRLSRLLGQPLSGMALAIQAIGLLLFCVGALAWLAFRPRGAT